MILFQRLTNIVASRRHPSSSRQASLDFTALLRSPLFPRVARPLIVWCLGCSVCLSAPISETALACVMSRISGDWHQLIGGDRVLEVWMKQVLGTAFPTLCPSLASS